MNKLKIGDIVGKWTLLEEFKHDDFHHDTRFKCQCSCGKIKIVRRYQLSSGRSTQCKSCARTKHGMYKTSIYYIWCGIEQRCNNPNDDVYKYYGGRGIKLCERWHKFENFLADMGNRPDNMELDRIDNNGHYEPGNCRWITHHENLMNRRCTKVKHES